MYLFKLFVRLLGGLEFWFFMKTHWPPPTNHLEVALVWYAWKVRQERNIRPMLDLPWVFHGVSIFPFDSFSMLSAWLLDDCDIKTLNTFTFSFSLVSFQSSAQHIWNGRVHHFAKLRTTGLELLGCQDQLWWPCDRWQGQTVSSMQYVWTWHFWSGQRYGIMGGKYDLTHLVLSYCVVFLHSYTMYKWIKHSFPSIVYHVTPNKLQFDVFPFWCGDLFFSFSHHS